MKTELVDFGACFPFKFFIIILLDSSNMENDQLKRFDKLTQI